jgi:septal ring factor EnvC (AmiA/AmiB activator)
LTIDVRNLKVE